MEDFIFGTLATDALRLEHFQAQRFGVTHRSARRPRDPLPGQEIELTLTVGPSHPAGRAWVYWSTDGGDPQGSAGVASHGQVTEMQPAGIEWDVLAWGYRRRFVAKLPAQPAGAVLRYRLSCAATGLAVSAESPSPDGAVPPPESPSPDGGVPRAEQTPATESPPPGVAVSDGAVPRGERTPATESPTPGVAVSDGGVPRAEQTPATESPPPGVAVSDGGVPRAEQTPATESPPPGVAVSDGAVTAGAESPPPALPVAPASSPAETFADNGAYYAIYIDDDPLPPWAQDAVVYQIFVDRFSPGPGRDWLTPAGPSGFYGGTLRGITAHLDWIRDLGATVLWLTPIFPSPSHHGYDASDLFEIEPRLGTKQDLADLLSAAHARGLRVLLDFVPNHWSSTHASFQDAVRSPDSPYRDWYTFNRWPDQYETFFGVKDLPQVNLRHPGARQHMLDAAAYWLNFGVDGFRVDYAVGPTPDFWAEFRRVTRQARPDCWTFGEVVEPSDSQLAFHGLLDGCLDFMLLEGLRQTFAFGRWSAAQFTEFLDRHEGYFPADFSRPSFLDNHDMNRILWALQGDRQALKLAALCQFTLAGPPVIYYGAEVGLSQERDVRQGTRGLPEEARLPMLWGAAQDSDLLSFFRSLIAFRRAHPQIWRARRRTVWLGDDIVAYAIESPGEPTLLVALNLSTAERAFTLPPGVAVSDGGVAVSAESPVAPASSPPDADIVFCTFPTAHDVPCYDSHTPCRLPAHSGVVLRLKT